MKAPIRVAASQSFLADEVRLMDQLVSGLMRGADVRVLTRSPHFANFARKVKIMRERVALARQLRAQEDTEALARPKRPGVRNPRRSAAEHDRVLELRRCGKTADEIAAMTGIPKTTVGNWIRGIRKGERP